MWQPRRSPFEAVLFGIRDALCSRARIRSFEYDYEHHFIEHERDFLIQSSNDVISKLSLRLRRNNAIIVPLRVQILLSRIVTAMRRTGSWKIMAEGDTKEVEPNQRHAHPYHAHDFCGSQNHGDERDNQDRHSPLGNI